MTRRVPTSDHDRFVPCDDCKGEGCFTCNETGRLCGVCGEAEDACHCPEREEEEPST